MKIHNLCVGSLEVNCYVVVADSGRAILIDPGAEPVKIKRFIKDNRISPAFILHTHGHIDHIGADSKLCLPVYIHKKDLPLLKNPQLNLSALFSEPFALKDNIKTFDSDCILTLDSISLKVIHTPGHTPGSCCFLLLGQERKILFSGDTLFYLGIGRTDFTGGCQQELMKSIKEKLFSLDDDTLVYPGHGPGTTIGKEKKNNPFLK